MKKLLFRTTKKVDGKKRFVMPKEVFKYIKTDRFVLDLYNNKTIVLYPIEEESEGR